ncbi:MAG: helix-turn-helix domain-containing protein, partial [bacterium]
MERNDFENIPAETYVRVFIKSISNYLGLDAKRLLKQYDEGKKPPHQHIPAVKTKPKVSINTKPFLIICISAFIVTVILFLFLREKDLPERVKVPAAPQTDSTFAEPKEHVLETEKPPAAAVSADSAAVVMPAAVKETPAVNTVIEDTAADAQGQNNFFMESILDKKYSLFIKCLKDSAWVWIYRENKRWANIFRQGQVKQLASDSPIYIQVTHPGNFLIIANNDTLSKNMLKSSYNILDSLGWRPVTREKWESSVNPESPPAP